MRKFQNVSPLGALDLPLVGRVVDAGEVITLTPAQAKHLAGQESTWLPLSAAAATARAQEAAAVETGPQAGSQQQGEGEGA